MSNAEKHRGYITTHRNDISYSSLYAAYEDRFIKIAENTVEGGKKDTIYRMDKAEKVLLENFLTARNQSLLFSKSNIGPDGKPTIYEPDTNRPIIISDGIIPQCEAYCNKFVYNKLSIAKLNEVISALNEKADEPTGNHYVFLCNERFWNDISNTLGTFLAQFHTDGTYLWSMKANGYVTVNAKGYDSYNYNGNTISFKVDRTFSLEYGYTKGFALALDLTGDSTGNQPPIKHCGRRIA